MDYYGGPRQCGNDDRSYDGRRAYVSHYESSSVHSRDGRRNVEVKVWRSIAGYCANAPWHSWPAAACGYDRHGLASAAVIQKNNSETRSEERRVGKECRYRR